MYSRIRQIALLLSTLVIGTASIYAQNPRSGSFIFGGGIAYGVAESHPENRVMTGQLRMGLMYAFSSEVAVEFGGGYAVFASDALEKKNDYSTEAIPVDLRVKISPFEAGPGIKPYVYMGFGHVSYTYDKRGLDRGGWRTILNANPNAIVNNVIADSTGTGAWYAPLGIGVYAKLSPRWGMDFAVGGHPTFNDDLNPLHDGQNDGYWSGVLSFVYNFRNDITDTDGDGLSDDAEETIYHTDPENPDTDGDGLKDGEEVKKWKTDPLKADSDGDGLTDGEEVHTTNTNPLKADSDGDGLNDYDEVTFTKTNPMSPDSDNDGLTDYEEVKEFRTNPNKADTDGDGIKDYDELKFYKTDPLREDTDDDGLTDGEEIRNYKTNPLRADTDGDELSDGDEEKTYGTNPLDRDTDHGSVPDGEEVKIKKTNPLDPRDDVQKEKPKEQPKVEPKELPKQPEPKPIQEKRMVLQGIKFENNKADILPESEAVLDSALTTLRENPDLIVEIQGHSSKSKNKYRKEKQEQELSQKRAESVRNWMIAKGIPSYRMVAKGYGTRQPAVPGDPKNQANRRIEFLKLN